MASMRLTAFVLCHRLEQYLDRAVASITTQTRKPDRIVLVGTDCRAETARAFNYWTGRGLGIEAVYSDRPLTCAQSKNFCGTVSKTSYGSGTCIEDAFFILDADDWILPQFINRCFGYLEGTNAAAVGCDYQVVDAHKGVRNSDANSPWRADITKCNPLPCVSIVRLSAYLAVGGYRENLVFEDWAFWIDLTAAGFKLYRFPHILFNHCRHASNLTNGTDNNHGVREIQCLLSSITAMRSHQT